MRELKITTETSARRIVDGPDDWDEACQMLNAAMDAHFSRRGGNVARAGTAARVAFALFPHEPTDDPTVALVRLMVKICQRKGAGLT